MVDRIDLISMSWVLYWSSFYFPRFITMRDGHWIFGSIFCRISMFTNCVTVSQHKEIKVNCSPPALIHRSTPRCSLCWQWPWRDTGRSWPRWPRGSHTPPPPPQHHHQHHWRHHHHHHHLNNQSTGTHTPPSGSALASSGAALQSWPCRPPLLQPSSLRW